MENTKCGPLKDVKYCHELFLSGYIQQINNDKTEEFNNIINNGNKTCAVLGLQRYKEYDDPPGTIRNQSDPKFQLVQMCGPLIQEDMLQYIKNQLQSRFILRTNNVVHLRSLQYVLSRYLLKGQILKLQIQIDIEYIYYEYHEFGGICQTRKRKFIESQFILQNISDEPQEKPPMQIYEEEQKELQELRKKQQEKRIKQQEENKLKEEKQYQLDQEFEKYVKQQTQNFEIQEVIKRTILPDKKIKKQITGCQCDICNQPKENFNYSYCGQKIFHKLLVCTQCSQKINQCPVCRK